MKLQKEETVISYSNQIIELIRELESAPHLILEIEKKRAILRGLTSDIDVTVEVIMDRKMSYHEALFKLNVKKTRLKGSEDETEKTLLIQKEVKMCLLF